MEKHLLDKKPTDHLANERTFLAWIRTSLGIMAFGFVIEKFSIFVKEFANFLNADQIIKPTHHEHSSIFGIFLIIIGMMTGIFSFFKYKKTEAQIELNTYQPSMTLATLLTVVIAIIGGYLAAYLLIS
jgi:putative membrane protein